MKKILITGAGGFIGWELFKNLKSYIPIGIDKGVKDKIFNDLYKIDLRNKIHTVKLFESFKPEIIYHLAAYTNPLRNDENPILARECNVDITNNLIETMPNNCHFIYLSTDKVLDGNKELRPDENILPDPVGLHSKLKYECEKIVIKNIKKYHILRLSVVHSSGDKKAISNDAGPGSFLDKAIIDIKNGKKVELYDNVYRCFLKNKELVQLLIKLKDDDNYGIYHLGSNMMSYFERVKQICGEENIDYQNFLKPSSGKINPQKQDVNTEKLKKTINFVFS